MRVLLDTHALLWALADPRQLSVPAASLLRDPATSILVSAASAWEIATKYRLGRLPGARQIVEGYAAHLARLRADELPVRSAHALMAGGYSVHHRDPFDRLLAAQATLEGLPLVTSDPAFSLFGTVETIW